MSLSPPSTVKRKIAISRRTTFNQANTTFMNSLRKLRGALSFNNTNNRYSKINAKQNNNNSPYEYMSVLSAKERKKITKKRKALNKKKTRKNKKRSKRKGNTNKV